MKNDQELGTATADALPEGPWGSIVRLAAHLTRFGDHLRKGQIVLTGSPLPLYRVEVGDRITVSSQRFDEVTATIRD
jgi:2-keto-4-pentenoate hydratase